MRNLYLTIIAITLVMMTACGKKADTLSAGIKLENLDQTALPGSDFYQFACGGWMQLHPLTAEYSRFGSFDLLAENNRVQLHELIDSIAKADNVAGSEAQKIGDYFNVAMDSVRLNNEGVAPILADIERIKTIQTPNDIAKFMGELDLGVFFLTFVEADMMNASKNIIQTYQGGIAMGQRDYYTEDSERMAEYRAKYLTHVANMFKFLNYTDEEAKAAADIVMSIETRIASSHYTQIQLRDVAANYNYFTVDDLKSTFVGFDWDAYFAAMGATITEISVSQPEPVKEAIAIMNDTKIEDLQTYMIWHLLNQASSFLSDDIYAEHFDFFGKTISGKEEPSARWKRAVSVVDGSLGMAVGKLYCEKYFTAEAKARMENLVGNLIKAYDQRMDNLTWMSEETRAKAKEKLASIYVKVGYPSEWKDYSSLEINPEMSYWQIAKIVDRFNNAESIDKLSKPVDKDEWLMSPQTVNAYYNPTTNEICFPAGILQYPFFDMSADDAFNYGAIGVVIAHEITHGFDDQGSQFDKDGNMANWWTDEDKKNFEERTDVMANYFNNIEVAPGLNANGRFTLGENIADHGGLQVAFQALKNAMEENPLTDKLGFTPEQRFFLAYANVWAGNIREAEIIRRTKTDPHSLGRWRVNGALPHIQGWYDAFGITENDPLYLEPEKRVSIW